MAVVSNAQVEQIWFNDVKTFVSADRLTKFIPDKSMTYEEQLNAAFRFSIYFSIVMLVVRQDLRVIYFAVFIAFLTIILYNVKNNEDDIKRRVMESLDVTGPSRATKKMCVKPTKENPYMNVSLTDLDKFPNRPQACNLSNTRIKAMADKFANGDMYKDVDDIYHKKGSDRQFFTNPVTTVPNAQSDFAHWLYNTGKTCKEDTIKCTRRLF